MEAGGGGPRRRARRERRSPAWRWLQLILTPLLLAVAATGAWEAWGARGAGPGPAPASRRSGPVAGTDSGGAAPTSTVLSPADALAQRLDAAFAGVPGCAVIQDGTGRIVVDRNGEQPFAPASTQKLLVAAAALTELGPDFRFTTTVKADAAPVAGAVNDLWLVGGGSPVLDSPEYQAFLRKQPRDRDVTTTSLDILAAQIAAAGVTVVRHPVHGDDSRYDRTRYLSTWPDVYRTEGDIGPLGALMVNGGFSKWQGEPVAPTDPAGDAASELARLLGGRLVNTPVGGDSAPAPAGGVVLARADSPPLSVLIPDMLRTSDNLDAELLTRELDRRAGGPGTTAGGVAIIERDAARLGLTPAGLDLADGSGLSPANRATCQQLLGAFDLGQPPTAADPESPADGAAGTARPPALSVLGGGYAVAGRSGTLVHRYNGTPLAGHLEAKTGWISEAAGMVGMMDVNGPVRFAFLANGPGVHKFADAQALEDRVLVAIAAYH